MKTVREYVRPLAGMALLLSALIAFPPESAASDVTVTDLTYLDLEKGVTYRTGLAKGYVADKDCTTAKCHDDLARTFADTDKAQTFLPVSEARFIEDFENSRYYHAPSKRYYEMVLRNRRLFFSRYQTDDRGEPINVFEQEVHWIQGAGTFLRSYLFRTPGGEIFQLPIAWYEKTRSWGMPPGYDLPDHPGLGRRVRRECQFCHNALSSQPEGSDRYGKPHIFPGELPHGIGCQRCHGPGEAHTRLGIRATNPALGITGDRLRASIVNPKNLPPERHNDICYQCHARTSALVPALVRFGRGDFSYRPGEPLSDYLVNVHVQTDQAPRPGQIGAISQPARLENSPCFRRAERRITCTECHDSHRKLSPEEKTARYRTVCLACHGIDQCGGLHSAEEPSRPVTETADCVSCHMPKRLSNVSTMIVTDHLIQKNPDLTAPTGLPDRALPVITGADVRSIADPALRDLYRTAAAVRAGAGGEALDRLAARIEEIKPESVDPYLILAQGQIMNRRWKDAERTIGTIFLNDPQNPLAMEWLGIARIGQGRREAGLDLLRRAAEQNPLRAEVWFNLGRILVGMNRPEEAVGPLDKALHIRPTLSKAYFYLGMAYRAREKTDQAVEHFRRALEIDPAYTRAYLALGRTLVDQGNTREALRFLRHGAKVARNPAVVAQALEVIEAPGRTPPVTP